MLEVSGLLIIASSRQLWEQESSTALLLTSLHGSFGQPLGAHPAFSPAEVNTLPSADILSIVAYKMPAPKKIHGANTNCAWKPVSNMKPQLRCLFLATKYAVTDRNMLVARGVPGIASATAEQNEFSCRPRSFSLFMEKWELPSQCYIYNNLPSPSVQC